MRKPFSDIDIKSFFPTADNDFYVIPEKRAVSFDCFDCESLPNIEIPVIVARNSGVEDNVLERAPSRAP